MSRRCSLNWLMRTSSPGRRRRRREKGEKPFWQQNLRRASQLLRAYLSEQVSRVLGFSASRLDVEQPISNLGLDSLMAVELKNRIAVDLGVNVPMVKFLQGPSVDTGGGADPRSIHGGAFRLFGSPVAPTVVRPRAGECNGDTEVQLLAQLDQLSDEEVNSLLTELLDKAEVSGTP